jgi:hypothetical protein
MLAKKGRTTLVFLALVTTALLCSDGLGAEEPEPKKVTLEGFVSVLRDANDVITSVQLITDEEAYEVVLDKKGLELGEEMEDEVVEVEGVLTEKDEEKWLKVFTYEAIEEEEG